jgi:hypothetical protein
VKAFVDQILTFSRSAAFAGWLIGAWGILAPDNEFHWPLTRGLITALVGLTIATFGRSVLAKAKVQPPDSEP